MQRASENEIDNFPGIGKVFFREILDFDYEDCFISDLTLISDFGINLGFVINKINQKYNLDIKDDLYLIEVFKLIDQKG